VPGIIEERQQTRPDPISFLVAGLNESVGEEPTTYIPWVADIEAEMYAAKFITRCMVDMGEATNLHEEDQIGREEEVGRV
jgi:hypothetical protein